MSRQSMYPDEARMYTRIGAVRSVEPIDITRPERVLQSTSSRYPGIWPCLESIRRNPWESCGLKGWQPWCYMPVNVVAGAMGHLHRDRYSQDMVDVLLSGETRLVSALVAWRMTKGVYKFDPTVLKAIMESDVKDGLPEEAFLRLPDWCVYIPTPGVEFSAGLPMHGFFAYVDDHGAGGTGHPPELNFELLIDPKAASPSMLRSLITTSPSLLVEMSYAMRQGDPVAVAREWLPRDREFIHLHQNVDLADGSFGASFARLAAKAEAEADAANGAVRSVVSSDLLAGAHLLSQQKLGGALASISSETKQAVLRSLLDRTLRLANLVLYLCADEADIEPAGYGSRCGAVRNQERSAKRTFAASSLESWDVGYRIGSSLRSAERELQTAADGSRGEGRSPRAHMRRAHWHTFLTGPRTGPQSRRVEWLPPIPVGAAGADSQVPTVHRVLERATPSPRPSPEAGAP